MIMKKVLIVFALMSVVATACKKDELKSKDKKYTCIIYQMQNSTSYTTSQCLVTADYTTTEIGNIALSAGNNGGGYAASDCSECAAMAASR
jgi:hypothetical protein